MVSCIINNVELRALQTPDLGPEAEKRGMEFIHYPIRDKWIPKSTDRMIALVEIIIERLKESIYTN